MSFACQKDSYRPQLTTSVRSCDPAQITTVINGKKQKLAGYEVVLEDTILFPEGGGQPDDRGKINDIDVLRVTRRGADAIHFLLCPIDPGTEVLVKVDWDRRWDHMQQHSAQHLFTALADKKFSIPTTSWNLGEKTSFIELDTANMSQDEITDLEQSANELIQKGVKVYPTLYEKKDHPDLVKVRTRGLPDDHVGAVRVVTIEGIDTNMCCGTHVSSLSHLQAVKILCTEKGKKNKVNLVFVAGQRLLKYFGEMYKREKMITEKLKGSPDQHIQLLEKLQKSYKALNKTSVSLLREVACLEAKLYLSQIPRPPYLSIHRKEGDNEYMNMVVNELNDKNILAFITTGDEKGQGQFLLAGPESDVSYLGPKIVELIDGKGSAKRERYQGKANLLSKRPEAEALIREYIDNKAGAS